MKSVYSFYDMLLSASDVLRLSLYKLLLVYSNRFDVRHAMDCTGDTG